MLRRVLAEAVMILAILLALYIGLVMQFVG